MALYHSYDTLYLLAHYPYMWSKWKSSFVLPSPQHIRLIPPPTTAIRRAAIATSSIIIFLYEWNMRLEIYTIILRSKMNIIIIISIIYSGYNLLWIIPYRPHRFRFVIDVLVDIIIIILGFTCGWYDDTNLYVYYLLI